MSLPERKKAMALTGCAIAVFVLLLPGCTSEREALDRQKLAEQVSVNENENRELADNSRSNQERERIHEAPPDGETIHYLGRVYTSEAFHAKKAAEVRALQKRLRDAYGLDFRVRYSKYFNIAYRCPNWRMDQLEKFLVAFMEQIYPRYFRYVPENPFQVVYFANKATYSKKTGSRAYGFYRSSEKCFYTYANSGHGTLWHEMIHAFVDANQSKPIQQWFDEGFASFYEMAFLQRGKVVDGYLNWRMPRLKRAIREGRFVPLKKFLKQDWMKVSFGYAQARFLFCYLWMHGKMQAFVKTYLFELAEQYSGEELGEQAIRNLEKLTGKSLAEIESEMLAMARRMRRDQKLQRIRQPST